MRKETFKKAAAISMATVMAIGGSLTAMAAGIEGTGTSTGHVEKKVVNVVFPVESDNATTFNYTMDAERLVTAAGSKMSGAAVTLPSSGDTGVYFLTDTGTYANESKKLDVVNKSSVSVIVSATAKATVQDGKTSITLADSSTITGDTPQLYLGIVVGDDEKAVTADGVTATATVAGYASNFTVTSNSDGSFSYGLVASPDETKWSKTTISLKGAVNQVTNVGSVVAPKVEVTWSYTDPSVNSGPSIATKTYTLAADTAVDITYSLGAGDSAATKVSGVYWSGASSVELIGANMVSNDTSANKLTLSADCVNNIINAGNSTNTLTVKFDKGDDIVITLN